MQSTRNGRVRLAGGSILAVATLPLPIAAAAWLTTPHRATACQCAAFQRPPAGWTSTNLASAAGGVYP